VPSSDAPERGDLIWLQPGRRPALVISPGSYNAKVGLALCCPISDRVKDYPFEVALQSGGEVSGVILADQIKSLDWRTRKAERVAAAPGEVVRQVLAKVRVLIQ